jgi:GH35 family endo-1,4-beta-xylanase
MKGHCLIYNSFQPDWLSEDSREIKIKIDRRLKAIAERYPTTFHDVDVINEMYRIYKNCYKGFGCRNLQITNDRDHEKWCFDICKKHFPHSTLYWNEGMFETFGETQYSGFRSYYYMAIKEALEKGAPVEGIGMQFHALGDKDTQYRQCRHVCNPLRLLDVFDCYGDFGLPISISEISLPSYGHDPEDEELQAELAKRLMKLWFGRKHVDSIVWWNLVDNTAFGDENRFHAGLLRNDCSEKPIFRVMDDLINKEWRTNLTATTDQRLYFTGFYGDYEIEATHEGKKVTKTIRLWKDNTGYDNRLRDFRAKTITF